MSNILEYKGYQSSIEFSAEDRVLFGKILHIPSLILFEANSPAEVESAFHKAVDDYLDYCRQNDIEPNKAYSGTLNVRIGPERHRQVALYASRNGRSLNDAICHILDHFFSGERSVAQQPVIVTIRQDDWRRIMGESDIPIILSMATERSATDEQFH